MIKVTLTNEILKYITEIEQNRYKVSSIKLPQTVMNKLRKNSKKKSTYASNKIEGNPLSEKQVDEVIENDERKHYLKPEQEVRNYFLALNFLEQKITKKETFSKKLILDVQKLVEKGASKEKIGLRGPMPPGVLFAIYDSKTGRPDYIPPEYFAYDIDEYYESIQMELPALYYSGRDNPPHPGIWISYFLRMVKLYSGKVCDLQMVSSEEDVAASLSFLKGKEKELLRLLITDYKREFTPIEVSRRLSVTNKTIINRLAVLVKNGFVIPILVNQRIRSYELSEFTRDHEKEIIKAIL